MSRANKTAEKSPKPRAKRSPQPWWVKLALWVGGIAVASLASVLGASLTGVLQDIVPPPAELLCSVTYHLESSVPDDDFAILLPRLLEDKNNRFRNLLGGAIRDKTGLSVVSTCRQSPIPTGRSLEDIAKISTDKISKWLPARNADVAI